MLERLVDWYTGLPDTYLLGAICVMLFLMSVPWLYSLVLAVMLGLVWFANEGSM